MTCRQSAKILKDRNSLKADSHIACRSHAAPMPCRALIHTCHAAPLPCSDSDVSFVNVRMVAGNIRLLDRLSFMQCAATTLFLVHDKRCLVSHWPPASEIGVRLITNSWNSAWKPEEAERRQLAQRPSLDGHAVPWPWEEWHGLGMASVNQDTAALCKSNGKDTF